MKDDERTHQLLQEIRDAQREQLAEYRRVTQQSLDLQQRAVARQEQATRLYKKIVAFGGVLVAALLGLLMYLLLRWSHYLFR
jgi:cytochrome c-type biogenesis protein CcmH/NrfG